MDVQLTVFPLMRYSTKVVEILACKTFCTKHHPNVVQDSVVSIASRYGLGGAEIESRW
jgi:hypothetical protein